jgi:hypothetical protein
MEAKFHRVLCASLNALKTFLGVIPAEDQLPLVDKYRTMLADNKFWKYAKHSQAMVSSVYEMCMDCHIKYTPILKLFCIIA